MDISHSELYELAKTLAAAHNRSLYFSREFRRIREEFDEAREALNRAHSEENAARAALMKMIVGEDYHGA